MTTKNFRVRNGLTIGGATSGSTSLNNSATGSDLSYTLPTALPAVTGYALVSDTSGNMSWAPASGGATYTIDASTTTGGANFNLVGSDSTTDTIKFASGTNITVSRTDANTITIDGTDTNTTYTYTASSTTGGSNLTLTGSDSTTNTIKLTNGTGVTNTYVSPTEVSINIGQDVATTADPTFNSIQLTAGTIKSSAGVTAITVSNNDATIADFLTVGGDMRVSGNTIYSSTNTALELSGQNVSTYGDLTIQGGDLTLNGSTSGTVTLSSPAIAGTQAYVLPDAYPGVNGYVLSSTTGGTMSWVANPDTNTTYTIDATATTGGADFNLVGSDSTTDTIKFAEGTGMSIVRTDANTITFANTSPGTTYTVDATATTGGANLNLVGSDSTTDTVAYLGSGATTVTRTDANTITVSSTDTNTTYTQNASATTGGANLNLVGSDSTTDTVTFQSGTNITVAQVDANTINISSSGITPTDVQQVFAEVRNQEGSTITIGQVVYLFGATGNNPTVKLADNSGDATSAKSLGLVYDASINNGAQGLVITQGLITGVNTLAFAEGDALYLGSTPGSVTNVKPYAPEHLVYIGVVVKSNVSAGEIFVRVQNGYELAEIHDVDLITNPPTNNQVLTYVAATQLWTAQDTQNIFDQDLNTTDNVSFNKVTTDTSIQWNGSTSGSITMTAPAVAGTQAYILPDAYPGTSGWALVSDTSGNMSWAAGANPFDQSLNTTDSVQFAGVSVVNGAGAFSTGVGVSVTLNSPNIAVGDGIGPTNGFTVNGGIGHGAYIYLDNADDSLNIGINGTTNLWKFNDDLTTDFPNYKFPAADGTNGQVPTTNGSGVITWQTPSGGSSTTDFTPSFLLGGM